MLIGICIKENEKKNLFEIDDRALFFIYYFNAEIQVERR